MDGFDHKVVTVVVRTAGWFSFGFWCAHGRLLWCCSKSETIPGPFVPAIQGVTGASISNDRREAGDITRLALWEKIRDNFFPFG